LTTFTYLLFM